MTGSLKIFFVRHGETAWTLSGQHTGSTDLPLTPTGEAMARELAAPLRDIAFSRVLSSPRRRARATCELAGLGAVVQNEPLLAEWDYGDYEGLRTAGIQVLHPGWSVWADGCPGGETPADVASRADQLIAQLQDLSGPVILFSHGQFGRVLAARWIGLPVTQGQHFTLGPTSLSVLGFEQGYPQRRVITLWNAPVCGGLRAI